MEHVKSFFIASLIIAETIQVSAHGIESSMGGFKLQTCSQSALQCVTITADRSEGSQFKQLHTLAKPVVVISFRDNPKKKDIVIQGDTGYIDVEENQIVVFKRKPKYLEETSINLTTFERLHSKRGNL